MELFWDYTDQGNKEMTLTLSTRHIVAGVVSMVATIGGVTPIAHAQQQMLTVTDLYDPDQRIDFDGTLPIGLTWLDNDSYIARRLPSDQFESPFVRVDAISGNRTALIDVASFEETLETLLGISQADARDLARSTTHLMNPSLASMIITHADTLYHFDIDNNRIRALTQSVGEKTELSMSPNGNFVAFVEDHNLIVVDLRQQRTHMLTTDGGPRIRNGVLDWVYQEEIYGRGNFRGYWWSPDSTHIAYLRLDDREVPSFPVIDHIPYHPDVETWEYPKAGDPNPVVQLGIVNANGGQTTWASLDQYRAFDPLIVDVGWTPDGHDVVFQVQDREQTWLDLNTADRTTGVVTRILRETSEAWVNVLGSPLWLDDGTAVWTSERSGWSHLYHINRTGKVLKEITKGNWEVRALHGVDENGIVYFSGTERSHIGLDVYRIDLSGRDRQRLSTTTGTHSAQFNPSLTLYIDTWSDIATPPQLRLHDSTGATIRTIANNPATHLSAYALPKPEFHQVSNRDGFVMEALMIKPLNFDPTHQYPVYQHVYGGPHIQRVKNAWSNETLFWQLLAQQGIVVWVLDNSTASGKGAVSTWPVYQRFGELELRDLEDGLDWLLEQSFVDRDRIGIEGWSYGGYMVSYALPHSQRWSMGIAGGSVTDWRDYDSIYTERYMRTPEHNSDGYRQSSPRFNASSLHGDLLLIHGSMDENVHMQNTLQFSYALQDAGKPFEMMIYPKSRHRLGTPALEYHRREKMLAFVLKHLTPNYSADSNTNHSSQ